MQVDDLFERELERMNRNMEKRKKRLVRDAMFLKELEKREKRASFFHKNIKKVQQLDLFAG